MLARLRALPRVETSVVVLAICVMAAISLAATRAAAPPAIASYSTYDTDSGGAKALYELFEREGVPVDRFERQALFLDKALATLVWLEPLAFDARQRTPSKAETAALESWVRAGGTFVYVGIDDGAARQGILKLPRSRDVARATFVPYVEPWLRALGVRSISSSIAPRWRESPGKTTLVADARGPLVVTYPYGRGHVIAVVDRELFSNARIALGDRARLAYGLIERGRPRSIAFDETTHGYFVPVHWWQIAPRPLVIAVVVALLALAIAGIGAAIRLGPPLVPVARDDATTADFIGALAHLLHGGRAQRDALVAASDSTTRALARSFGLGEDATAPDVAQHLERPEDRAAFATMLAVAHNGFPSDDNLVRGMALAQRLRKDHAAHVDRRR